MLKLIWNIQIGKPGTDGLFINKTKVLFTVPFLSLSVLLSSLYI